MQQSKELSYIRKTNEGDTDIDQIFTMLMREASSTRTTAPLVDVKYEEQRISEYTFNEDACIRETSMQSPFSQSNNSSPCSSYGNVSGPSSPVNHLPSMLLEQPPPPPYDENYLNPSTALYAMNPASPTYSSPSSDNNSSYKYDPRPLGRKKRRHLVPDDKKTNEYWERRKRNNIAARRSREERRNKELQTYQNMQVLQQENIALKQTINMLMKNQQDLQGEVHVLRQMLEQACKI